MALSSLHVRMALSNSCVSTVLGDSQYVNMANSNSQCVNMANSNLQHVSTVFDDSQHVNTAICNSQHVSMMLGNLHVSTALDGSSQDVSTRLKRDDTKLAEDKPMLDHLQDFGCVVWKYIPKCQRMDAKIGAYTKAYIMLRYVHNTTKIWRIWDPDFGKAINCSDVYFDKSQTAYTSCMADNKHSIDSLGLPEEDSVITEVIEDPPENTIC